MKILVTDDIPNWVRHHCLYLRYIFKDDVEIHQAFCAREADRIISCNIDKPFDIIFTDLQMESDFLPMTAGEWLIKQIQFYPEYKNTNVIIVSASPIIEKIAQKYNVNYIRKRDCETLNSYENVISID